LRPDPLTVDVGLAVVLTLDALLAVLVGGDAPHHRLPVALMAPVMTVPIAFRRRHPLFVGTLVPVAGAINHSLWDAQSVAYPIAEFCALYGLAVWTTSRGFVAGALAFVAAGFGSGLLPHNSVDNTTFVWVTVGVIVMLLVRNIVKDRERKADLAERERDIAAREAVVEERARIARELHDAIAHNVSMVVMQAGAERRVLEKGRGSPHEVLETIEQVGRGALVEMRRMIGMLRSERDDPLAPQPGLADVPTLVTQVREAGPPVELRIEGTRTELPLGIELSAYRIIQEALTNTLKHAGDARASVIVRYGPDSLELEITDDGPGTRPAVASGGHGLVGMKERVALYGGKLDAGHRPGRGFAVRVLLPVK
jgi:signal transduction histidine kinase